VASGSGLLLHSFLHDPATTLRAAGSRTRRSSARRVAFVGHGIVAGASGDQSLYSMKPEENPSTLEQLVPLSKRMG